MENRNKEKVEVENGEKAPLRTGIKEKYFFGIGTLIAYELKCSNKYVRDVLNGHHDERETELVRKIKALAEEIIAPVSDSRKPEAEAAATPKRLSHALS